MSPEAKGRYRALSFVNGPDLWALLEARGAFGLPLTQLVAQHLIAAVAYCHARGVMHRDIRPGEHINMQTGLCSLRTFQRMEPD